MATNEERIKKLETQMTRVLGALKGGKQISGPKKRGGAISSTRRTPEKGGSEIVPRSHWMRFEYTEGKSNKFWAIRLHGPSFITHWGRIGQTGQETTKKYASMAEARAEGERLISAKIKKGYKLVTRENPTYESYTKRWWAR